MSIGRPLSRRGALALTASAAACPAAWAQDAGRNYHVGFLVQPERRQFDPIFDELRRAGFIEGRNLSVDSRGFGIPVERLEASAAELVQAQPDAIYSGGAVANQIIKRATTTIPVVVTSDDIVRDGIVTSLSHPDANITGISIFATELDEKRLGLLLSMAADIRHVGVLVDPGTTPDDHLKRLAASAQSRGVRLSVYRAAADQDIAPAIDSAKAAKVEALTILASAMFHARRKTIIAQTSVARLPTMYQWPEYCAEGALVAYGPRFQSMYRQAGGMLIKVLKGSKPANIPVEQPTKFELAINLQTARELGLAIPSALLAAADEVVE
jgi:putative tryptophan/tyrosine transport system substrate-binding protein